jgi:hypothetical protein
MSNRNIHTKRKNEANGANCAFKASFSPLDVARTICRFVSKGVRNNLFRR